MKKIILVLMLSILSNYAYSAEKNFDLSLRLMDKSDVDTFYKVCKEENGIMASMTCYSYIAGARDEIRFIRAFVKDNSSCDYTNGDFLDRFNTMYERNMFDIGLRTGVAFVMVDESLCPYAEKKENNSK